MDKREEKLYQFVKSTLFYLEKETCNDLADRCDFMCSLIASFYMTNLQNCRKGNETEVSVFIMHAIQKSIVDTNEEFFGFTGSTKVYESKINFVHKNKGTVV